MLCYSFWWNVAHSGALRVWSSEARAPCPGRRSLPGLGARISLVAACDGRPKVSFEPSAYSLVAWRAATLLLLGRVPRVAHGGSSAGHLDQAWYLFSRGWFSLVTCSGS